jgi:anti-sigma B factor antagonist
MSPPRVVIAGEIDLAATPALDAAVAELEHLRSSDAVLDLRAVTFMSAAGANFVARLADRLARDGGRLYAVAASRAVLRVLELSGVNTVVEVIDVADHRAHELAQKTVLSDGAHNESPTARQDDPGLDEGQGRDVG